MKFIKESTNTINVAYSSKWRTLAPPLQSSAMDDFILSNQFDSLVEIDEEGNIAPNGAKSWVINDDFTEFIFHIDTNKTYSDGSKLKASDYKVSFENSLRVTPLTNNKSTQDGLYNLVGFESFVANGEISGIKIPNESTLILNFRSPYRQALEYLSWTRFVSYKKTSNQYIGTGRYIIKEIIPFQKLLFTPNPHHAEFNKISEVQVHYHENANNVIGLLDIGKIDVYEMAPYKAYEHCKNNDRYKCYVGPETTNIILEINGIEDNFFSDSKARLGFQSFIHKLIKTKKDFPSYLQTNLFNIQAQTYISFQKGVLSKKEEENILKDNEKYIPYFFKKNKEFPIFFITTHSNSWFYNLLEKQGINFTDNSGLYDWQDMQDLIHKTQEVDVAHIGKSVVSSDPDGVYHFLGKNGAVANPMSYRKKVSDSLEIGRSLLTPKEIEAHYQDVSRLILSEVPYVNLGTLRSFVIYNENKIEMKISNKHRNFGKLHIYNMK